jgi:hypothetical protein
LVSLTIALPAAASVVGTVTRPRQFGQVFCLPADLSPTDSFLPQ